MTATVTESMPDRLVNTLPMLTLSDNSREELAIMKRVIRNMMGETVLAVLETVIKRELEKQKSKPEA